MSVVEIEYVDYGAQGEYGFFGKVIARSDVRGMSNAEIAAEIRAMREALGEHVGTREIIEVAAIAAADRAMVADMERDGLL